MIRVAVIGVGSMGKNHARVYNELPQAELVAVADSNDAIAQSAGALYGVIAYSDYRKMLEKEKPEAVSIAVPTALHLEVALDALRAGVHILVEKPIAATLEQGEEIIAEAHRHDRCLMVGHIVRFNPALQELKKRLDAGELGRVFQIFCRRAGPFPARIRDVGVVVDLAPHDIDIMRFLTGMDPQRIYAEIEQRIHTEHEDLLFALLRFPDHITAAMEINWLTPTKIREVSVLGERGLFRVDDLTQDLYYYENAQVPNDLWQGLKVVKGVSEGVMTRFALQRFEPLKAELRAFLEAVSGKADVPVTGKDGLMALGLALKLVESGRTHQVINL
jgi:UDP-N-acetylglucosamine 3-dehydrogenase